MSEQDMPDGHIDGVPSLGPDEEAYRLTGRRNDIEDGYFKPVAFYRRSDEEDGVSVQIARYCQRDERVGIINPPIKSLSE